MPEDAGKPKLIKDFLQQVQSGTGLSDDIRIERIVRLPGTTGEGSTARSLSGRTISNVTELLEDDLKHTFDEGYFTFRFVAALVGSGKTSLITYLQELTKTKLTYESHSVVVRFQLSDISLGNDFLIKLYSHILADTFWTLLHNSNLLISVKEMAEKILMDFLEKDEVSQLKAANKLMPFRSKFKKYIIQAVDGFEEFFFHVIGEISSVDPKFSFVYLIDELDALAKFPSELEETRLLFKQLIRRAFQQGKSKVKLLIYLVGTSENVGSFITGDSVIESLVSTSVINLNKGYINEFDLIRRKIDQRIEGAYKGYKNFPQAWKEIQEIPLNPANTLRDFCQNYASSVLEIHEKYFQEAPEQKFEGDARQLVEAECRKYWGSYLKKSSYTLSKVSTTTVIAHHAFDCYVELLHNGVSVARAFGEAKNYELLSGHLQTFEAWLKDVNCQLTSSQEHPPDLAFMIAPSCPTLLKRKLEIKNIHFIKSDKQVATDQKPSPQTSTTPDPFVEKIPLAVNINTASREELINAFKGTKIKQNTIDLLINLRESKVYDNLDELVVDLKSTANVKKKLQDKLNDRIICF